CPPLYLCHFYQLPIALEHYSKARWWARWLRRLSPPYNASLFRAFSRICSDLSAFIHALSRRNPAIGERQHALRMRDGDSHTRPASLSKETHDAEKNSSDAVRGRDARRCRDRAK